MFLFSKKRYLIPLIAFFVLGLLLLLTAFSNDKSEVIESLESKYGEEFVVEDMKKGNFIFSSILGRDKYSVYPVDNKDLVFLVTENGSKEEKYIDNYVLSKWGYELTQDLGGEIKDILPNNSEFKLVVYTDYDNYESSMLDMEFSEYIKDKREETVVVLQVVIETNSKSEVGKHSQNLATAYNVLKKIGVKNFYLTAGFIESSVDIPDYIRNSYVFYEPWEKLSGNEIHSDITIKDRSISEISNLIPNNFISYDE